MAMVKIDEELSYKNNHSGALSSEHSTLYDGRQTYELNTVYETDALSRPISSTVTDKDGVGYKQTISYEARQHTEKKTYPAPSLGDGVIRPPLIQTIVVDDGTTPYIANVKTYAVNGENQVLEKTETLSYDSNGNITKYGNNSYVYDGINRLIRENNADLNKTFVYNYDEHGNILSKQEYDYTTGSLNTGTTTHTFTYNPNWSHQLLTVNGATVEHNCAGGLTNYNGKSYGWKGRNLTSVTEGNKRIELSYDGLNVKRSKSILVDNEERYFVRYLYGNGKLYGEKIADWYNDKYYELTYTYNQQGVSGILFAKRESAIGAQTTTSYTYRKNLFGDITEIYSGATCVAKYKYDAWGNCTVCNPDGTVNTSADFIGNINPFRYRGYYWDRDLGLYHLQTRYYDPAVGRFISPDSYEYLDPESFGGLNLYCYCLNNPVNNYDPTGHFSLPNWAKWVIGSVAFAGAVALTALTGGALAPMFIQFGASIVLGGLIQGTVNAIQGGNFWEGFVDGAASGALTGGVLALGQSIFRVIKVANYASKGLTIGKKGVFDQVGQMTGTAHYDGLKSHKLLSKLFGETFADKVGWIQNKSIVQGVMKFKGVIYDCGGELTGAYAKEIALTKGYQYFVNIWLL